MNSATPTSYYFADPSTFNQDEWRAFGPMMSSRTKHFSLSSCFSSWGTTVAYAICKGVVFVQPHISTEHNKELVNLILRPIDQPFPGIKVKYFVYRGIRKEDLFITDNNVVKILPSSSTAPNTYVSDFITKINASFSRFYTSRNQPIPEFLGKYIGFDPDNQANSLLLDDFLFKHSTYTVDNGTEVEDADISFELPLVQGGDSLGRFVGEYTTFAMDIVLDYGDFREPDDTKFVFDLNYVRSARAIINLEWMDPVPGVEPHRPRLKEQILQFVDIIAFYGAFADGRGKLKAKGGDGIWYVKAPELIFSELLSLFHSKNRWYFYIQSDRTRSYNFYGNYAISDINSNNLKKGYAENAMAEASYNADGWPILIDEGLQVHSEGTNSLYLQFTKSPNNVHAMFYAQVGNFANAQHNNFCDANDLSLPDDLDGTPVEWSKPLKFTVPAVIDGSNRRNVASFAILLYQGREYAFEAGTETDENNVTTPVYATPNYFDEVFDGLDAIPLFSVASTPLYSTLSKQRLKLISQYYNQTHYGIAAVQTTKVTDAIATDSTSQPLLKRVTYIAESVDTLNNAIAIGGRVNNGAALSSSAFSSAGESNTYQLPQPFYYERQLFTDGTTTVTGLRLKTTNGALPDRIMVGMTETEHDALKALILNNGVRNARLFLIDLFEDGNELISAEGITYQKYRLGIVAEQWDGPLKMFTPVEDIIVYAIDRYYYYTEGYSRYMPDMLLNIEYLFVNEVI